MNGVNPFGMRWFKCSIVAIIVAAFMVIDLQAATLRSDLVTNSNAVPIVMNNPNVDGGVVRRKRATYTFDGTEATGDIIEMVTMEPGSIIQRALSTVVWGDMAVTACLVEVGDVDDPNRYISSLQMEAASTTTVGGTATTFEEATGYGGTYTHNIVGTNTNVDTVDITLTTVTTPNAAAQITIEVVFVSTG